MPLETMLGNVTIGDGSYVVEAMHFTEPGKWGSTVVVGAGSQLVNRSFAESGVKALVLGRAVAVSDYSFQRCYKLHSVVSSTNDFGQGAFSACKGLLNVIMTEPIQLNTKHKYSWRRGGSYTKG